jgi:hypothetical protein
MAAAVMGCVREAMRKIEIAPHRTTVAERLHAEGVDMSLAPATHERDEAGDLAAIDVP